MVRFLAVPVAALISITLIGCGPNGPQLASIHGKVTIDGQPLEKGTIKFDPGQAHGSPFTLEIKNGQYRGQIYPGQSRVFVSSLKVKGKRKLYDTPDSATIDEYEESIPEWYNKMSMLSIDVKMGTNEYDVEMTSVSPLKRRDAK